MDYCVNCGEEHPEVGGELKNTLSSSINSTLGIGDDLISEVLEKLFGQKVATVFSKYGVSDLKLCLICTTVLAKCYHLLQDFTKRSKDPGILHPIMKLTRSSPRKNFKQERQGNDSDVVYSDKFMNPIVRVERINTALQARQLKKKMQLRPPEVIQIDSSSSSSGDTDSDGSSIITAIKINNTKNRNVVNDPKALGTTFRSYVVLHKLEEQKSQKKRKKAHSNKVHSASKQPFKFRPVQLTRHIRTKSMDQPPPSSSVSYYDEDGRKATKVVKKKKRASDKDEIRNRVTWHQCKWRDSKVFVPVPINTGLGVQKPSVVLTPLSNSRKGVKKITAVTA